MADLSNSSWSETDSNNSQPSPDGFPSGILPSQVGGAIRAMRGALKRSFDRSNAMIVSGGSTADNVYTLTYEQAPTGYTKGEVFRFFANFTNTAAALVNINGLGNKNLVRADGAALSGGELVAGQVVTAIYDGTNFLHQSTGTRNFKDNVSIQNNSDSILTIESLAAPATTFRVKKIYSSVNVNGGNDWLFRQVRPSDGAVEDWLLKSGSSGTIYTTGNFDPNTRVAVAGGSTITGQTHVAPGVPLHFNSISANGDDGKIGTRLYDQGLNIIGAATESGSATRYITLWGETKINNGGFSSSGDISANGKLIVGVGQPYSYVQMNDTDDGIRYLHNNSGTIGFLGSAGDWTLRTFDTGAIWSKQMGDLNTFITTTANNAASSAAYPKVAKTGDLMSGDLEIANTNNPSLWLHYRNVKRARFWMGGDGYLRYSDQGGGEIFRIGPGGDVYTQQFGDLNSRIETRGQDWGRWAVNQCAISMRMVYIADMDITAGYNGGVQEYYGGSCVTGRASIISGDQNDIILRSMRFRQNQILINNQGWVAAYFA